MPIRKNTECIKDCNTGICVGLVGYRSFSPKERYFSQNRKLKVINQGARRKYGRET